MKIIITNDRKKILRNGEFVKATYEETDICNHCKVDSEEYWDCLEGNEIEYDDCGLACCQECMDANPKWKQAWDSLPSY